MCFLLNIADSSLQFSSINSTLSTQTLLTSATVSYTTTASPYEFSKVTVYVQWRLTKTSSSLCEVTLFTPVSLPSLESANEFNWPVQFSFAANPNYF